MAMFGLVFVFFVFFLEISEGYCQSLEGNNSKRTLIFVKIAEADHDDDVFIRGGVSRNDCNSGWERENDPCAIKIRHNIKPRYSESVKYNRWSRGDDYLDWWGRELHQLSDRYLGVAEGTPLTPTTNVEPPGESKFWDHPTVELFGFGYTPLNTWGAGYWMFDADVNCDDTQDDWFEFKVFLKNSQRWENDVRQGSCTDGVTSPIHGRNHVAKCGEINVFSFNKNECDIHPF